MLSVLPAELKEDKRSKVIGIRSLLLLVDMSFDLFLKDCFGGGVAAGDRRKTMIKDLAASYRNDCQTYCRQLLQLQRQWRQVCLNLRGNTYQLSVKRLLECLMAGHFRRTG